MSITPQSLASELLKKLTPTCRSRNELVPGDVEDLANFMVSPPSKGQMEIEDDIEDIEVPDYPDEGDNTDVSTPFREVKAKTVWKKPLGGDFSTGKKNMMLDKWLLSKGKAGKESARKIEGSTDKASVSSKADKASVSSKEGEEKSGKKNLLSILELDKAVEQIEEEVEDDIEAVDFSSVKKRNRLLIDAEQSEEVPLMPLMRNLNEIWGDGDEGEEGKRKRSESGDEEEEEKKLYKKVKKEKEGKVVEKKSASKSRSKSKSKKEESPVKKRKGAEEKAKAKKESKAKKRLEEESEDEKPRSKSRQSQAKRSDSKEGSGKKKTVVNKKREESKDKSTPKKKKEEEKVKSSQKKKGDVKLVKGKGEKDSKGKKDKKDKKDKSSDEKPKAKKKKDTKEKKSKKSKKKVLKKKNSDDGVDENDSELSRLLEGGDDSDDNDNSDSESEEELPFKLVDGEYVFTGTNKMKDSSDEEENNEEEDEEDDDDDKPGSYWKKNIRRSSQFSSQKKRMSSQLSQRISPFVKIDLLSQLKSSKKVLMFSGLSEDDVSFLYAAAKKLGNFDIQTLPLPQMSHLIYDGGKRTIKVLYALAKRAWILEKPYVYASYEFGDWVPEKAHESSAFPSKKDRDSIGPLFKDIKFFFKSSNYQNIALDELTVMIKLAGGIICKRSSEAELVIENGEEKEDFMVLEEEEEPIRGQKKVSYKWILDSLTKYNRLPFKEYVISSEENSDEDA